MHPEWKKMSLHSDTLCSEVRAGRSCLGNRTPLAMSEIVLKTWDPLVLFFVSFLVSEFN